MLATGALSLQGYLARSIRSVTMLGSGCYGAGSFHSYVKPLLMALCLYGFPGGFAGGVVGRLVGSWASAGLWPIETLFYWTSNTEVRACGGCCVVEWLHVFVRVCVSESRGSRLASTRRRGRSLSAHPLSLPRCPKHAPPR